MRFKLRGVKYIHSTQVFETYRLGVCSNFQSGSQWRQFEASMMISCPVTVYFFKVGNQYHGKLAVHEEWGVWAEPASDLI